MAKKQQLGEEQGDGASPLVTFRSGRWLQQEIDRRGKPLGRIAKRDLERYYEILVQADEDLPFTEDERDILVEAFGPILDYVSEARPLALSAMIHRSPWWDRAHRPAEERDKLATKLRTLTLLQRFAVLDYVERAVEQDPAMPIKRYERLSGAARVAPGTDRLKALSEVVNQVISPR